jgi:GT2 family glycosyltransferase
MLPLGDLAAYEQWVQEHDVLDDSDREAIRSGALRLPRRPKISLVLLATPGGHAASSQAAAASVRAQLYPYWELWAPPASGSHASGWGDDRRIRALPASTADPAAVLDVALAEAGGEFIVPLPPDASLPEHALYEVAAAIADHPDAELVYTDEDRLDASGRRCHPRFKTAWDPDLMLGRDAVGHLAAYSRALLRRLGGMRAGLPSLDLALYDLALRAGLAAGPARVRHVPAVLCHRRGASEAALGWDAEGARGIVRRHLAEEEGEPEALVLPAPLAPGWNRVVRPLPAPSPLVSVIVPTRDRADLLERCTDAVLSRTDYAPLELLVVDNDSQEPATLALLGRLARDPRVRVLRRPGPFNFPALNNHAAREARGEVLLLLNNDTDATGPGWLREMVSHALRPDVGAVGAKLLYADGRVQHAGVVLGPGGAVTHQLRLSDPGEPGPGGELALARTVSAVTGACLALRRSVFFEAGGLDEQNLAVIFNDIDLCLRVGDRGYRVVWTPFAELLHLESVSRGFDQTPEKRARMLAEWAHFRRNWEPLLEADPFHNPNLTFRPEAALLATPPRRERSWRRARPAEAVAVPPAAGRG